MSKEVKLGLAIGGILLSVMLVYVLVVSGDPVAPEQVTLALPDVPVAADTPAPSAKPDPIETPPPVASIPENVPPPATQPDLSPAVVEASSELVPDRWVPLLANGMAETTTTPIPERPVAPTQDPTPIAPITAPQAEPPVAPRPAEPVAGSIIPRTHTVRAGETFSSISAAVYGSSAYFAHLVRANPGLDAAKLRPGMVINIPPEAQVRADRSTRADQQARTLDERTEYRVESGDSLYKISMKLYGKPDRWEKLYETNKATIGSDKTKLQVGMVLKLPEAPTVASR